MNDLPENQSAFPRAGYDGPSNCDGPVDGMSLRDYFAGQVAPSLWVEMCRYYRGKDPDDYIPTLDECAQDAYRLADAMMAERAKESDPC